MTGTFSALSDAALVEPVRLGPVAYDIVIGPGLLARAGEAVAPLLSRPRAVVLTDETVAALHGPALEASLRAAGLSVDRVTVPAGEATKSLAQVGAVADQLIALGVERSDTLIALGGGVVGDLAGFVAAVLHRGMAFIQIPTTLLAQVDSSVGGKTGVNLPAGKNLVGAFHQPRLVLADTDVLLSLSEREFRAGYAEVVKYGALGDAAFFDWLDARRDALLARDGAVLGEAVRRSCAAKARLVEEDEREAGRRALLNLGHTFGHAFEACAGYDGRVLHGEAVAAGMGVAFDLSVHLGLAPGDDARRLKTHLSAMGLPAGPEGLGVGFALAPVMAAMARDKKVVDGRMTFILARGLGQAFITRDVEHGAVEQVLRAHGLAAKETGR